MKKDQKGVALLLVFILMVTLLGLVSSFLFMVAHQTRHSGGHLEDEKAFYVAQAGLRKAVWKMITPSPANWHYSHSSWLPVGTSKTDSGSINTGDQVTASYSVTATLIGTRPGRRDFTIEATGNVHGIARRITRDYQARTSQNTFTPLQNTWREI